CGTSSQASRPLSFSYYWTGSLMSEGDPASGEIVYTLSPADEVTSIANQTYNPLNLVSTVINGPNGPVSYQLGNGLSTFFSYDSLGRRSGGWVCNGSSQQNCAGGTQIYGYTAYWKGTRNIGACDTVLNLCENFGYDEFDRLTSQSVTQGTGQSYTAVYDRYGNRWQENTTSGGQYSFNANNQIVGNVYDPAGNMLSDGSYNYTYDAEGNILTDSSSAAQYVYDALNQRVRTQTASAATEYIFDYAGRRISSWLASNNFGIEGRIYWDGMPIAFHAWNNYTFFQHQDWMGTERMRTDYAGAVADTDVSLPFGDGFSESFSEAYANQDNNHFAQLERDSGSSTDHAQFRQYSEAEGRWHSPDPYDGSYDFSNPQSFNRYSYVLNNPLSFTDPSGQDGGLVLCAGGPVACAAGVAVTAIFDWKFFESLFGGPSFHGSLKPRPNSQPWDEHNIMYGPNIAGALGLPDAGCDFGACGDISSGFQQQGPSANSQVLLPLLPPLFLLKFRDLYPWNWGGGDSNLVPGTHYCGPGGWGQPTGQVDIACQAHDLCYNNLRINAAMNVLGLVPNSAKAGQTACDQQLCNAISGSRLNQQEMGQALV
ncbi:MAG: RHS repeat-associated core domain-containing protein, partial [Alloacidobacterium sp.]